MTTRSLALSSATQSRLRRFMQLGLITSWDRDEDGLVVVVTGSGDRWGGPLQSLGHYLTGLAQGAWHGAQRPVAPSVECSASGTTAEADPVNGHVECEACGRRIPVTATGALYDHNLTAREL